MAPCRPIMVPCRIARLRLAPWMDGRITGQDGGIPGLDGGLPEPARENPGP